MISSAFFRRVFFTGLFSFSISTVFCQTVTEGGFGSAGFFWDCNPEAYASEVLYGGSSFTNLVAEVDQFHSLCQTINGFTPGSLYSLNFLCSARSFCGAPVQEMTVSVSGGVASKYVSRNNAVFNFTPESITFVASSTSHTINFTSISLGPCNLIVDNVQIVLISALPVELLSFESECGENDVNLAWQTASETNVDYFAVERSADLKTWTPLYKTAGQLNSQSATSYSCTDKSPENQVTYYRLTETDLDGSNRILAVEAAECKSNRLPYPNPVINTLIVSSPTDEIMGFINSQGKSVPISMISGSVSETYLDLSTLEPGVYFLKVKASLHKIIKE